MLYIHIHPGPALNNDTRSKRPLYALCYNNRATFSNNDTWGPMCPLCDNDYTRRSMRTLYNDDANLRRPMRSMQHHNATIL